MVQHAISKITHYPRSFNMKRLLFAAALVATSFPAFASDSDDHRGKQNDLYGNDRGNDRGQGRGH